MAVKQAYTATATWTAVDLANIFRSAFIDAGYMTEWFDSFSSGGIENRVLEVIYDGTKTFGKTYYWFKFTTSGVFFAYATGWNPATDQPIGTGSGLDFLSNVTNATTGHSQFLSAATSVTTVLTRYTSTDAGGQTWFLLRAGATSLIFNIDKAGVQVRPFLDLDRQIHCGFNTVGLTNANSNVRAHFSSIYSLRRSYAYSHLNAGATNMTLGTIGSYMYCAFRLGGSGSSWVNSVNQYSAEGFSYNNSPVFMLPHARQSSNPAFAADKFPVVTGLLFNQLTSAVLPSDIGLVTHYANNGIAVQDKFIVSAGTNEWEVLAVTNSASVNDHPGMAFAARIV